MIPLTIRKDDWIVFANGIGVYTFSKVLRVPRAPNTGKPDRAVVDTIDGGVYRRLVREVAPTSRRALEICNELNMEGAMA
jgi:hypothetical protein